ncbi:hypothetical protein [Kitasatospora mediocidica]|uniref:hypothetical protein n=1 Tax=Kitasatospora mediocidica TaxID=58352 RepID=UPI00055C7058|nr:hypothetical protein [Kitasatospora mediocidica]
MTNTTALTTLLRGADNMPKTADHEPQQRFPKCDGFSHGKYLCSDYAKWKVLFATQAQIDAGENAAGKYSCGKHLNQLCQDATERYGIEFAQVRPLN